MLLKSDLPERDEDTGATPSLAPSPPRHSRRLSDKVLIAFHHACDVNELDVAEQLIRILEAMMTRRYTPAEGNRRRNLESLVAAHERLWHLRHPSQE